MSRNSRWSPEAQVLIAPWPTYRALVAVPHASRWWTAIPRPAFVALLLGTSITIAATGRIDGRTLLSAALYWSIFPLLQMAGALVLAASASTRSVSVPRAIDLFFVAHAPWSLWFLVFALSTGLRAVGDYGEWMACLALLPLLWQPVLLLAYCEEVLKVSRRGAIARTLLHQMVTWSVLFFYAAWAVAFWTR